MDSSDGYMCKMHFQIKNETVVSRAGTSAHEQTCLPMEEALELPLDDFEVTESTATNEVIKYEYHVLYSCSYQVPVLYFRASFLVLQYENYWNGTVAAGKRYLNVLSSYCVPDTVLGVFTDGSLLMRTGFEKDYYLHFIDGRPLALKDIWEGVHECYKTRLLQGPWDTISQQEHPILGQPFFVLHPCKTNEFMTPVLKNSRKINRNVNYITSWLSLVGPVVGLHLPLSYAGAASQDE
nr:ubiquitin-like-conjugating enzyme ATG10 isoform X2 [Equus caballus]